MMTQAWPWPILPQGQIGSCMCLNAENFYKVINWEKLAVYDQFDKKFMFLTKKYSQGVVCPCPCPWTIYIYMTIISNISSESTVPNAVKAKFYLEPLLEEEKKVCLIFQGHMARMAAMPRYGENFLKKFCSRTKSLMILKLGMQHVGLMLHRI